ncbi:MAG: hypothetical protein WBB66_06780, partial [Candidatus Omnitrophota bacterium]
YKYNETEERYELKNEWNADPYTPYKVRYLFDDEAVLVVIGDHVTFLRDESFLAGDEGEAYDMRTRELFSTEEVLSETVKRLCVLPWRQRLAQAKAWLSDARTEQEKKIQSEKIRNILASHGEEMPSEEVDQASLNELDIARTYLFKQLLSDEKGELTSFDFSDDGKKLIVAFNPSDDKKGKVLFYEYNERKKRYVQVGSPLQHDSGIYLVKFMPDGNSIILADMKHAINLYVYNAARKSYEKRQVIDDFGKKFTDESGLSGITTIDVFPGRIIARNGTIQAEYVREEEEYVFKESSTDTTYRRSDFLHKEYFSPDNNIKIVVTTRDENGKYDLTSVFKNVFIYVFDKEKGEYELKEKLKRYNRVHFVTVAFSPDSKKVFIGSFDSNSTHVTTSDNASSLYEYYEKESRIRETQRFDDLMGIRSAQFTRDGKSILTAAKEGKVRVHSYDETKKKYQPHQEWSLDGFSIFSSRLLLDDEVILVHGYDSKKKVKDVRVFGRHPFIV